MNTQIDWREELDSSFGSGLDRPPAEYLGPGHAALRRRRTALGAAALAGVLVIGGVGWALAPGHDAARSSDVATDPTPTDPTETNTPTEATETGFVLSQPMDARAEDVRPVEKGDQPYLGNLPVGAVRDGNLAVKDGWSIEEIHVLQDTPKHRAWGVSAVPDAGGDATWMIIEWERKGGGTISDPAGKRFARFEDWMNTTWAEQQGSQQPPPEVSLVDGELHTASGVEVLERVDAPAQAAAYGPVEQLVAVKLRLPGGPDLFALVTPDQTTTLDPAVLDAPTMAAFLRHLAEQADSGEGLR